MTTKAKKRKKQQQQRLNTGKLLSKMPSDLIICEGSADTAVAIEAAEDGDDGPKTRKFSMTAYTGGKMELSGFPLPVVVDLSGMKVSAKSRPILRDHDISQIVGHTDEIQINAGLIKISGRISGANTTAQEIAASADSGFPWQASIGARVVRASSVDRGETVQVNGRTFTGPIIVARKSVLREISFVALGADDNTSAKIAASASSQIGVTEMNFDKWLEAGGWKLDDLSDSQKVTLQASYDAEIAAKNPSGDPDPDPADPPIKAGDNDDEAKRIEARRKADAAEIDRVDLIREICAKYDNPKLKIDGKDRSIEAMAIEDGWDRDKTELEAMRESRPKAPAGHAHSHAETHSLQAMQGAMMLRANVKLDHDSFQTSQALALDIPQWLRAGINDDVKQKAMEAAHRMSDMSMIDMCREGILLDGRDIPSGRGEIIEAAFSGSALTNIFTTNVNTIVLATYMETGDTTSGWTRERDVSDFKTNERPRMTKGPNLARLPRGGTADHTDRSDILESYKIARYARMFEVDDQDMIDDSFDALSDTPREMGLAAARLRPDLVYSILLANANLADSVTLFDSSHNNLKTSAGLAASTIKTAVGAIELQAENSVNLNLRASHLIVPSELRHPAAELIRSSTIVITGSTDSERGNINTINSEESLSLVSDSRLSNGVTDPTDDTVRAGSATTWYVASSRAHTIEVGYLRGTGRAPSIRPYSLDKGRWGIGFDVKIDIGAKALDFRGFVKNTA